MIQCPIRNEKIACWGVSSHSYTCNVVKQKRVKPAMAICRRLSRAKMPNVITMK